MSPFTAPWARRAYEYAGALLFFALPLWLELHLAQLSGTRFLFLPFSLAVAAAAWHGGVRPGLLVVVLSAVASDYFFLTRGSLSDFGADADALAFAGFVAGWAVASVLIGGLSRRLELEQTKRAKAEDVAAQADRLSQVTAALGQARTSAAAIDATLQETLHSLRADAAMFLLIDDDRERLTVPRAAGYGAEQNGPGISLSLAEQSPLSESVRRLSPIVIESKAA